MFSDLLVTKRIFASDTYNYESWNFPNVGYYCPADGLLTAEIPPYHCTLHCLQMPDCVTLNYNKIAGLCTLLPAPCTLAFRREGMEYLMFNGRTHDPCVKWVPYPGSDLSSLRAVKSPKGDWMSTMLSFWVALFQSFKSATSQMVSTMVSPTILRSKQSPLSVQWAGSTTQQVHHYHQLLWWQDALLLETICMWRWSHWWIITTPYGDITMMVWALDIAHIFLHVLLPLRTWWSSCKWCDKNQVT